MADQPTLWDRPQERRGATTRGSRATPPRHAAHPARHRPQPARPHRCSTATASSPTSGSRARSASRRSRRPGHCFFTLKDANSQVRAALFREELARAAIRPAHGMNVIIHGRVRAYEPQGVYQLYVDSITPAGAGDLHAQYEALRAKLAAEGLFEDARKRPIPRWPRRIGVVTSPVRAPCGATSTTSCGGATRSCELILSPSVVQGVTAAPAIVRALQRLYAQDAISTRSSWPAAAARSRTCGASTTSGSCGPWPEAPVPIIVGVGHESDVTLADFAADLRAPTPSAAAELATPDATQFATVILAACATGRRQRCWVAPSSDAASSTPSGARWRGLAPDIGRRPTANGRPPRSWRAGAGRPAGATPHAADRGARRRCAPCRRRHPRARLRRRAHRRTAGSCATRPTWRPGEPLQVIVARGTVDTRVERTRADGTEELSHDRRRQARRPHRRGARPAAVRRARRRAPADRAAPRGRQRRPGGEHQALQAGPAAPRRV